MHMKCMLKCGGRSLKCLFRSKWVEGKDTTHQRASGPGGRGRAAASVKVVYLNHIATNIDWVTRELIGPFWLFLVN